MESAPAAATVDGHWSSLRTQLDQLAEHLSAEDLGRYGALCESIGRQVRAEPARVWNRLVAEVGRLFRPRGWAWNGIYRLGGDRLELSVACGPPVCATLERTGGVGSSGACFDGILLNRTLVIPDTSRWPGYVSCDGHSGLQTRSSIVIPIRSSCGSPVGVWDLDCEQCVTCADGLLMEALIGCIALTTTQALPS